MYIRNGHPRHRRPLRTYLLIFSVLALCAGGSWLAYRLVAGTTSSYVSPTPKAVVTKVVDKNGPPKHIDEKLFSLDLPGDWVAFAHTDNPVPAPTFSWENTAKNKGVQIIDMYIDNPPANLALNNILPVKPVDGHFTSDGDVSASCGSTLLSGTQAANPSKQPMKLQGVNFICDPSERHVVGIGVAGGSGNKVSMQGPTTGPHTIFMTYADANANANDGIFQEAVQSFKLK